MTRMRSLDTAKLSAAVSRPGIDPREWVKLGRVDDVAFDPAYGWFADVTWQPSGAQETCMVGLAYATPDGGASFCPIPVGSTVVAVIPDGDPNSGPVIVAVLPTKQNPPPATGGTGPVSGDGTQDPTEDVFLYVRPGRNVRVRVAGEGGVLIESTGSGDVRLQATGSGKVKLGDTNLQPAVLGQTLQDWAQTVENRLTTQGSVGTTLLAAYNAHTHVSAAPASPTSTTSVPATPSPPSPPIAPDMRATDTEVK